MGSNTVLEWDLTKVTQWLHSNGFAQHEKKFRDNDITGDVLVHADHEMLKELDVSSLGHRIAMLKSIYQLKKQYGVPLEPGDYVPETVELETQYQQKNDKKRNDGRDEEVGKLQSILKERDQQIQRLGKDVEKILKEMNKLKDELEPIFKMSREFKHILEKEKKHSEVSKKHKHSSSSRKSTKSSPEYSRSMNTPRSPLSVPDSGGAIRVYGDRLQNREGESYKSFRISLEDPCSKVLPAALKKYKINDDWQQYALFIVYRNSERCLGYDESPLSVYNQLKEAGEDPVFVLKHIKQVKNPASRTSDQSVVSSVHSGSLLGLNSSKNDTSASSSSLNNANSGQPTKSNEGNLNGSDAILNSDEGTAVVIYEYAAQREDELDISIGDKLNIKQRSTGWYVVEKNGQVGWVPMGCLLEDTDTDQFKVGDGKGPARGYALYDYAKIGPNELSIRKGDVLMVHKKYQHWLLADCNSRTGWVPSCYVSMEIDEKPTHDSQPSSGQSTSSRHSEHDKKGLSPAIHLNPALTTSIESLDSSQDTLSVKLNSVGSNRYPEESARKPIHARRRSHSTNSASGKLMTLLDSMSPYLKDDERPIGNAPKSAPLPQSGTSKAAVRLEKVLHEISDNLSRLRNEASSFSNTPGTYTPRLQEHQEQIDTTLGLVNVISSVHPHNPRFSQILDRLEKVALISQPVVVNDPAPKETPKRLSIIQTSIEDTYDELNEIVSLLTEEPIMITSSKSRNRPSTPVKSSSHSSQSSQDRLIIQTERSQSTRAESPPKDSAFVSSGSESIRLKSRAPIDNTGMKSRSRRSISSPNLAEANS